MEERGACSLLFPDRVDLLMAYGEPPKVEWQPVWVSALSRVAEQRG